VLQPDTARITASHKAYFELHRTFTGETIHLVVTGNPVKLVSGGGVAGRFGTGYDLPAGDWDPCLFYLNSNDRITKWAHELYFDIYFPRSFNGVPLL